MNVSQAVLILIVLSVPVFVPVAAGESFSARTSTQCDGAAILSSGGSVSANGEDGAHEAALVTSLLSGGGRLSLALDDHVTSGDSPSVTHDLATGLEGTAEPMLISDSLSFTAQKSASQAFSGIPGSVRTTGPCAFDQTGSTRIITGGASGGGVLTGGKYTARGHADSSGVEYDLSANGTGTFRAGGYVDSSSKKGPAASGRLMYHSDMTTIGRFTVSRSVKAGFPWGERE